MTTMNDPRLPGADDLAELLTHLQRESPEVFTKDTVVELLDVSAQHANADAQMTRLMAQARAAQDAKESAGRRLRALAGELTADAPLRALPLLMQCRDLDAELRLEDHLRGLCPAFTGPEVAVENGRLTLSIEVETTLPGDIDAAQLVHAAHAAAATFNAGTADEPARLRVWASRYSYAAESFSIAEATFTFPQDRTPEEGTADLSAELMGRHVEQREAQGPAQDIAEQFLAAIRAM